MKDLAACPYKKTLGKLRQKNPRYVIMMDGQLFQLLISFYTVL
jgi:hypothetical protein